MAIKLLSKKLIEIPVDKQTPEYVCEYLCDFEGDVPNLPVCAPSSMAICIDTGAIYMVNTSGEWAKFGG